MFRRKSASRLLAASVFLFGLPLSANAITENAEANASQTPPSVIVFNQTPKNGEVTVTYAFLPSAGHLVIHGVENGMPDKNVLGSVKLEAGDHRNVAVKLEKNIPAGTALWASLTNSDKQSFWRKSLPLENQFHVE